MFSSKLTQGEDIVETFFIVLVKPLMSPRRKPGSSVVDIHGFRLSPERQSGFMWLLGMFSSHTGL